MRRSRLRSKLMSTLSGLAIVAALVGTSALLGEPTATSERVHAAPAAAPDRATLLVTRRPLAASLHLEMAGTITRTGAIAPVAATDEEDGAQSSASDRRGNLRRLHLTMPYFAVGRLLAHGAES